MICYAEQLNQSVWVYDENGKVKCVIDGELNGYTSTTVSIKKGESILIMDENGKILLSK